MTWWKWTLLVLAVVTALALATMPLWPKNPNAGDRSKLAVTRSAPDAERLRTVTVTRAQLAAATCKDGARCWVSLDGVVYDLGGLKGWASGRHHGVKAGTDATEDFVRSGHGRDRIEHLPVVGRLTP